MSNQTKNVPEHNTIRLIHSMVHEIQRSTHFMTKVECTITVEGLRFMVLIHNGKQGKTYGIDHLFTVDQLAESDNAKYLVQLRDKILKAVGVKTLPPRPVIRTEKIHGMMVDIVEEGHYDPEKG